MEAHILILIYAPNHDNGLLTDSSFPLRLFRPKKFIVFNLYVLSFVCHSVTLSPKASWLLNENQKVFLQFRNV